MNYSDFNPSLLDLQAGETIHIQITLTKENDRDAHFSTATDALLVVTLVIALSVGFAYAMQIA